MAPRISLAPKVPVTVAISVLVVLYPIVVIQSAAALDAASNLSSNDGISSNPQIATSGDNVYVVWQDDETGDFDVLLAASSDDGESFSGAVDVSENEGQSTKPDIAASGNDVYVVWQDSEPGNGDIMFSASTDGGTSFAEPINVSDDEGVSSNPSIAASGDSVYVVWQDSTSGADILLAASGDNGETFGEIVNVSDNTGLSSNPQVATSEGILYVAWQDDEPGNSDILFAASNDEGATFGTATNISHNPGLSELPQLVAIQDGVYATWSDDLDIYVAASSDDGASFSDPVNVSANDGESTAPSISASNENDIFVSWSDNQLDESNAEIFLSASADGGSAFACPINLSATSGASTSPQSAVAGDGSSLHLAWADATDNSEVLLLAGIDPIEPVITADIANTSPRWDLDEVSVSGIVGNTASEDTVTVRWGDGSETSDIPISGCSWGPVIHSYTASAVETNPNGLVAALVSDSTDKAVSEQTDINVEKHLSILTLDPVSDVEPGSNLSVTGLLTDSDARTPIADMNITFTGSGAGGLSSAITDGSGIFTHTALVPNSPEDGLEVQAHFAGTLLYEPEDSQIRSYDIVVLLPVEFGVHAGEDLNVDLTGFNASVLFEEVTSDGVLSVSKCDSPESPRYLALDRCLSISSDAEMAEGSGAIVKVSYADQEIPSGHSAAEIGIFHAMSTTTGTTIVDVTKSRDVGSKTVAGEVSGFSDFIVGIALHHAKPVGAHRMEILLGDDNFVSLRDINNQQNSSAAAAVALDKLTYRMSDRPVVTFNDPNGNIDPSEPDLAYAEVRSDTSHPLAIAITLTETGASTGTFQGSFGLTRSQSSASSALLKADQGDKLSVSYTSGARLRAEADGVTESGLIELSDYVVNDGCFKPIGGAVDLKFVDSALGPEGKIKVAMSYANAILGTANVSSLKMVHKEGSTWLDITLAGGHDSNAKTITGETHSPGPFSLAASVGDCSVGAGAGGGFERGIVLLDAASIIGSGGGGGGSGGGGGGGGGGAPLIPRTDIVPSGQTVVSTTQVGSESVTVIFETVYSSTGLVEAESQDISELRELFSGTTNAAGKERGFIKLNDSTFTTAGTFFAVDVSAVTFGGLIHVTVPYNQQDAVGFESNVRLLHYDDNSGQWQDATISIDTAKNTVTGTVESLSLLVAAIVNDATFDAMYFELNPLSKIVDTRQNVITVSNADGNSTIGMGETVMISNSIKNLQRVAQSYTFVIEVFDEQNRVIDLNSGKGYLDARKVGEISGEWKAASTGKYTIKIFVIDDLNLPGPSLLKEMATTTVEIR